MRLIFKKFLLPVICLLFKDLVFCKQNDEIQHSDLDQFKKITLSSSQYKDNIYSIELYSKSNIDNNVEAEDQFPLINQNKIQYELIINSNIKYIAYLLVKDNSDLTKVYQFNYFRNYYHLQILNRNYTQIQLVLEKTKDSWCLDSQNQSEVYQEELNLKHVKESTNNYCPFQCFNNGSCTKDNTCVCDEDYEQDYFCSLKIVKKEISINEINKIDEQSNNQTEGWSINQQQLLPKKEKIYKIALKDYDNISKAYFEKNIQKLTFVVKFYYQKRQIKENHGILIFCDKQFQKILLPEQSLGGGIYSSNYEVDILNILLADEKSREVVSFLEDSNIYNLNVIVTIQNEQIDNLSLTGFLICITVFIVLICLLRQYQKYKNLQNINQQQSLNSNQQTKNKYEKIKDIEIQKQLSIQLFSQISSLQYNQRECYICLEILQDNESTYQLKCGHIFHVHCLNQWLQKHISCPIDRMIILEKSTLIGKS